jgi:hypothetical protein
VRAREAVALSAYYGVPSCELTDTAVLEWRVLTAERAETPGVQRYVNPAFDPS